MRNAKGTVHNIADLVSKVFTTPVKVDERKQSFKGICDTNLCSIKKIGGSTSGGSCILTFELVSIPNEASGKTALILRLIFGEHPGKYHIKESTDSVTLYYQIKYKDTPVSLADSIQLAKDLDKVKEISSTFQSQMPVKPDFTGLEKQYESIADISLIRPMSKSLYENILSSSEIDLFSIIDNLLGNRTIVIRTRDHYSKKMILQLIATMLQDWNKTIGLFTPFRFSQSDLIQIVAKSPYALSVELKDYFTINPNEDIKSMLIRLLEIEIPKIILADFDSPIAGLYQVDCLLIYSFDRINILPELWLEYLIETHSQDIDYQKKDIIKREIMAASNNYSQEELTPMIMQTCIHRYLSMEWNKNDPTSGTKEYLFKILELNNL